MNLIEDIEVVCPYCGSSFTIEADTEGGSYSTIEDCAVCCRPIAISIRCHPGEVEGVEAEPGCFEDAPSGLRSMHFRGTE